MSVIYLLLLIDCWVKKKHIAKSASFSGMHPTRPASAAPQTYVCNAASPTFSPEAKKRPGQASASPTFFARREKRGPEGSAAYIPITSCRGLQGRSDAAALGPPNRGPGGVRLGGPNEGIRCVRVMVLKFGSKPN